MKPERKGLLCAVGATIFFGCGNTALKLIYRYFDQIPFQDLSLIRSLFCMAVFLLLLLRRDPALLRVKGKELAFFAFTGVCGLFLVQFCMLLSLQFAPVGVCSFTQSSSTIMVCLCSVALFHERISREKRLGIAVGLTGLAFVVWNPEILQGGRMFAWGVLAATVSAFLILGEPLLWNHLLGAALTVTSVLLIHRDTEREP